MADEAKLCSSIGSTFEELVVRHVVRHCHGKELGHFCWPVLASGIAVFRCISLICWAYFSDVIVLLGSESCNGSDGEQTTSDHDLFLVHVWLWSCFSWSSYWTSHCQLSYKIHFLSHITIRLRNGLLLLYRIREDNTWKSGFSDFWSALETPTYWAFSPFQFASNAEWLENGWLWVLFNNLCSCKRISFDCSQLVIVNFWWLATILLIFKALISFTKLLEPPLHCTFVGNSWTKCVVDVVSCLHYAMTYFEHE